MKREGKDFSGRVTPLFSTMLVQVNQEEGVAPGIPTDSQQTPITTQPSSSRPKKKHSEDRMQLTELMILCTNLQKQVLDLEKTKDAQAKEISGLKKRQDASKQGRSLEDIDKDAKVSLADETQGRTDDAEMLDTDDLHGNEVVVDMVVAMMEADRLLAEKLQTREQEELTDEEKAKLFMEFIKKRRKHFAALRAQEKRNKPPTKTQKRNQMSIYLKHMGGYKHKELKGRSYDEIQKLFDKEMKRVNSFVAMNSEAQEINGKNNESSSKKAEIAQDSSAKRAGDKLESDKSKKQKTNENEKVEVDNEAELKMHMVTVKDDDMAIDAIPLATKPPVIVEYKLIREGIMGHYQLIRADGSSKRYSSMIRMLRGIDKEDLQTLWKLVKTKDGDTRPEDEHERVLWGDLKVMF
ncbi:hypothetical protein Tco_1206273 [Tanacetum coccineum]